MVDTILVRIFNLHKENLNLGLEVNICEVRKQI